MAAAIGILVVFACLAVLMYLGRLPALLALPILAVAVGAIGGLSCQQIAQVVVADGALRLHAAYAAAMMGSMLAVVVEKTGVAETLVKKAAELGGDRPLPLALLMTAVVAVLFITLGGLGAVIMVATIVFPILLSVGVPPLAAGCLFLMGMSVGGIFNLINWQFYEGLLGLDHTTILRFAVPLAGLLAAATVVFAVVHARAPRRFWAVEAHAPRAAWYALLTPLVPLVAVVPFAARNWYFTLKGRPAGFEFPIITALLIGVVYGVLTGPRGKVQLLTRSVFEGIGNVAPAVALMLGIGMVMNAVAGPAGTEPGQWKVAEQIRGVLLAVIPGSRLGFVLVFSILAPLALYRGPLNLWGMGSGLVAAVLATRALPPTGVMAAFFSVGLIQGVCDPTNTHNVWIANHLGVDVQQVLRRTLPYVWAASVLGLIVGAVAFLGK